MCGRYTNETEFSQIRLLFEATDGTFRPWTPKYNISPSAKSGFEQPIVTLDRARARTARLARFWLIPSFWAKPLSALPTTFNARSEELEHKNLWREPYARARCLVPATGWREFVSQPATRSTGRSVRKQPYHFRPLPPGSETSAEPRPFAFAGLWSSWTSPEGEVVDSFAILTTTPSAAAAQIHDRMPLVVPAHLYEAWLRNDAERDQVLSEARQFSSELELEIFPSDPLANSVHYEGPDACRRVDQDAAPALSTANDQRGTRPAQLSLLDRLPRPDR